MRASCSGPEFAELIGWEPFGAEVLRIELEVTVGLAVGSLAGGTGKRDRGLTSLPE